jgi:glutathione S-transferase
MKFYNSVGPNPRIVRMFLAEKGVTIPTVEVDLMKAENRKEAYTQKNPAGQVPCLELDDGSFVTEISAICEYIEETNPKPALIGSTPKERAETRSWLRRADLNICEPTANGFRWGEGLPLFKERIPCFPEASPGLKQFAQDRTLWLDKMIEGRQYLAGDRFTLADIHLFGFLDFAGQVGQPINPEAKRIKAWFERVKARPSAKA